MDSHQKVSSKKHKKRLAYLQKLAKNKATRLGKSPDQQPTELCKNLLPNQLNPKRPRYLLSHVIAWKKLEEDLAPRYKKDEFGSKGSVDSLSRSNVVAGIANVAGNAHDRKTLVATLAQVAQWTDRWYGCLLVDKGYRGHTQLAGVAVIIPDKEAHTSAYALRRHKTLCKGRSGIGAIIGHLKSDHRLCRNYFSFVPVLCTTSAIGSVPKTSLGY